MELDSTFKQTKRATKTSSTNYNALC